jgi:hypothetical protein
MLALAQCVADASFDRRQGGFERLLAGAKVQDQVVRLV